MFFLISFAWLVAASFAFVLAILTPNWVTFTYPNGNYTVQRGIFYICNLISSNNTYQTTQCVAMIQQGSSTDSNKWIYQFSIACGSLAITCAGLSIIAIWLSGFYFQARRRTKQTSCALLSMSLLLLLIFCISFIVWILLISESVRLGIAITSSIFNWPMWLAVGATGGYLMSFITILFSYCAIQRRQNKREKIIIIHKINFKHYIYFICFLFYCYEKYW